MLKDYRQGRHIVLEQGKSTLALEPSYWLMMEYLAEIDGVEDWREWFYLNVYPIFDRDVSLAAHTRLIITTSLLQDLEEMREKHDSGRLEVKRMENIATL